MNFTRLRNYLVVMILVLVLAGCTQSPQKDIPSHQELTNVQIKVDALAKQIEKLQQELSSLQQKIEDFDKRISSVELQQFLSHSYESATFDPAEAGPFQRLDTSMGSLAVSIQDVQPFANGIKVKLHIGNLTAANMTNVQLKAKWGKRMPKFGFENFNSLYKEWENSLQEKTIPLTVELKSGWWNNVTFTLSNILPQDFGYLNISIETSQISLLVPPE